MILHAEGSLLNGRLEVSIDVQPHTELEHEILLLFFQNRSVSLSEAHEGDKLAVSFAVSDTTLEGLGFRNLERVKSGQPRFMSVAAERAAQLLASGAKEKK